MAKGPEGRQEGKSVESPPAPRVGGWWEYRAGDATEYVVLGTAMEDGVEKVSLVASVNVKDAAEKGSLVTAVKIPLREFEETMMEIASPRSEAGNVRRIQRLTSLYEQQHSLPEKREPQKPAQGGNSSAEELTPKNPSAPSGQRLSPEAAPDPAPTFQPETRAEQKQQLKERIDSLVKNKNETVRQKKEAYFSALKKYQEERGRLGLMAEGVIGEISSAEVKQLRKEWIEARAAVARAQLDSVEERLDARKARAGTKPLEGLKNYAGKGSLDEDEVMERYSRLVTFRSVVMGAEEEEREVRLAALSERERKLDAMETSEKPWLERARAWYKRQPPGARILGTAAIMTGGAALAFGAGPMVFAAGVGSAGLRWFGEARKSKNPELSETAYGLSRLTSVAGIFGAAVEGAAVAAHKIGGSREKAAKTLEKRGDLGDLSDVQNLEQISKMRKSAANVEENIARDRRRGRMLGSILGGAVLGGLSADEARASGPSDADAASGSLEAETGVGSGNPQGVEAVPPNAASPEAVTVQDASADAEASAAASGESGAAATGAEALAHEMPKSPEGMIASAVIDTQGEGTNQLFLDLRESVRANEVLSEQPSPAVQHILDTNVNQLSRDLGTEAWNSSANDNGLLTHMGDRLIIDENQNVWIQQGDNPPQLYLENVDKAVDPNGFRVHTIEPAFESSAAPSAPEVTAGEQEDLLAETENTPDREPATDGVTVGETSEPTTGARDSVNNAADSMPGAAGSSDAEAGNVSPPTLGRALGEPGQVDVTNENGVSSEPLGRSTEAETDASLEPLSWSTGNSLPSEASFFKYFDAVDGKEVFYANGMQPNQFIEFANQHGIDLRGTIVRFDNPVATFGGMSHQINQIEFGLDGRPVSGVEQVVDASGNPEQYLDTRLLRERIA